jgi:hypothetical protein
MNYNSKIYLLFVSMIAGCVKYEYVMKADKENW